MENNKIQEINNRLTTDQAFAEELKNFLEGKEIATPEEEAAAFIEFAKLNGYDITIDELKAFAENQSKALSEEELDSVNAAGIVSWITKAVLNKVAQTFAEKEYEESTMTVADKIRMRQQWEQRSKKRLH
jgi:uncharacterized protein YmfQ (DUF2313 family)